MQEQQHKFDQAMEQFQNESQAQESLRSQLEAKE